MRRVFHTCSLCRFSVVHSLVCDGCGERHIMPRSLPLRAFRALPRSQIPNPCRVQARRTLIRRVSMRNATVADTHEMVRPAVLTRTGLNRMKSRDSLRAESEFGAPIRLRRPQR